MFSLYCSSLPFQVSGFIRLGPLLVGCSCSASVQYIIFRCALARQRRPASFSFVQCLSRGVSIINLSEFTCRSICLLRPNVEKILFRGRILRLEGNAPWHIGSHPAVLSCTKSALCLYCEVPVNSHFTQVDKITSSMRIHEYRPVLSDTWY